jgi:hypothetical protein
MKYRLVPETNKDEKKSLNSRLQSLTMWGVMAIALKRRIEDIEGTEDSGDIVFKETKTKLDIYFPIDMEDHVMFNYQLSQNLIKHCGITDTRYETLVQPILTARISSIPKLFEKYDLDGELESDAASNLPRSFFSNVQIKTRRMPWGDPRFLFLHQKYPSLLRTRHFPRLRARYQGRCPVCEPVFQRLIKASTRSRIGE